MAIMDTEEGMREIFPPSPAPTQNESNHTAFVILQSCVLGLLVFGIILANVIILMTAMKLQHLPVATKHLVISLALADLGVGINTSYSFISSVVGYWPFTWVWCLVTGIHAKVFTSVSVLSIVLLVGERYVAIEYPFKYASLVTLWRVRICIVITWSMVEIFAWIRYGIFQGDFINYNDIYKSCSPNYGDPDIVGETISTMILYIFVPALIIIVLCGRIAYISHKHARQIQDMSVVGPRTEDGDQSTQDSNQRPKLTRRHLKGFKTMCLTAGCFIVAWFPFAVTSIYTSLSGSVVDPWIAFLTSTLAISNSFWNAIIYNVMSKKFRRTARTVLGCNENVIQAEDSTGTDNSDNPMATN